MATKKKTTTNKKEWWLDKKKYHIINAYPSQTITQWSSDYNVFYGAYLLAKERKDKYEIEVLTEVLKDIKKFLKEKTNIKFI